MTSTGLRLSGALRRTALATAAVVAAVGAMAVIGSDRHANS
ncbi:hypothetical protein ACFPH6_18350 [Streptomyces xiangluensis]|uniref:Uncharacterized protein n=1 Tax=Streptomyces xiangluensis TaxID=2665720 RepID=A0ABV8YMF3_9ACTN